MSISYEDNFAVPGDRVGSTVPRETVDAVSGETSTSPPYKLGRGVYEEDKDIFASIRGEIIVEEGGIISVVSYDKDNKLRESILEVNDIVTCRVVKLSKQSDSQLALTEIIAIGDNVLKYYPKGKIKQKNARKTGLGPFVMNELYRPGDIVLAKVISLGDSQYYFLSTVDDEHGVIFAKSSESGQQLERISETNAEEMYDRVSNTLERRKVALPCKSGKGGGGGGGAISSL